MTTLKTLLAIALLSIPVYDASAEIPDWYAEAVPRLVSASDSIVRYRTESISLVQNQGHHYVYKISTTTLEILKGSASANSCYYMDVEGPWKYDDFIGEVRLAILSVPEPEAGACRLIDVGYSAPGTDEYIKLFKKELDRSSPSL